MNKRKLIFLITLILILAGGFLFAQNQENTKKIDCNWFTNTRNWSISVKEEATNYYDFNQYQLGLGVCGNLDMNELKAKAGLFFENGKLHESTQMSYAPTLFGKLNPGILLQDHFCWNYHYYVEYDFLAGPFVEYRPCKHFKLNCAALFQQSFSFIFSLPSGNRMVYSCCPAFYFDFYFYPLDWMYINLSCSSYSFYRYFLFLSPDTKLAVDFIANKNLTLEIAAEIQAVDFFTMSANFNTLAFSVGANWRF